MQSHNDLIQRYGSKAIAELAPPLNDDQSGYDGVRVDTALWDGHSKIDEILRNVTKLPEVGFLQAAHCVIACICFITTRHQMKSK